MQRIVFADSWSAFFAEFNFKSFDDFYENLAVKTIGVNKKRNVITFNLGPDSQKKKFFMKRFSHPYFKDMLFCWRNIGRPCSQARYEWENTRLLLDNGVETYRPVCFGEKITCGIENSSFFVTEELQSQCLTDFIRQNWPGFQQQQKEKIVTGLAAFIRKIHNSNICLPDLYVWHIYITENAGEYEYAVIDLHRMSRNVSNRRLKIKSLGRMHYSMLDSYFNEELKQLFVKSYAADDQDSDVSKLLTQVKKYSDVISARRKQIQY
ncbi:MAG: lipopolysaccharide kinase InaA family protein [Planctomycetota bacterium]